MRKYVTFLDHYILCLIRQMFKGTIVNRALSSLHGESLEITLTDPLTVPLNVCLLIEEKLHTILFYIGH